MISGAHALRRGATTMASRRGGKGLCTKSTSRRLSALARSTESFGAPRRLGSDYSSVAAALSTGSSSSAASASTAPGLSGLASHTRSSRTFGHLIPPQGASWNAPVALATRRHPGSAMRLWQCNALQPRWISTLVQDSGTTSDAQDGGAAASGQRIQTHQASASATAPLPKSSPRGSIAREQRVAAGGRRQISSSSRARSGSPTITVPSPTSPVGGHWAKRWLKRSSKKVYDGTRRTAKNVKSLAVAAVKDPRVMREWARDLYDATAHFCRWVVTGFRLFSKNVGTSYHLAKRVGKGYHLTVRERNLLVRTTSDCLKLIPFSFFLIVPFAELLLPVALRLFPNMMPSTFFESKYDNATLARKFEAKQQMADFWQQVIAQRTQKILEADNHVHADKAVELQNLEEKLLSGRDFPSVKEILHFSKLFKQEMQINAMTDEQLRAMSKMLGLTPMTLMPHNVLQLRHHITSLRREDREYMWEGIDSLTKTELIEACKRRAIRFHGVTKEEMRRDLTRWLEISANKEVPTSLLLWIQSFYLNSEETIHQTKDMLHPGGPEPDAFRVHKVHQEPEVEVEKQASEAFHDMAERRKAKKESAEKRLEELQLEFAEILEEEAMEESEEPVVKGGEAKKASLSAHVPAGSNLEEEQETKRCILMRIEELSKAQELNRRVIEKQRDMLRHQIEFMAHMRDNAPEQNKDAGRILLDQRVRLVEMMRSYSKDLEEIEQIMETADKVTEVKFAEGDLDYISGLFDQLDINRDGVISKREFEQAVLDGRFDPKVIEEKVPAAREQAAAAGMDFLSSSLDRAEWAFEQAKRDRELRNGNTRNGTPGVGIGEATRRRDSLHA